MNEWGNSDEEESSFTLRLGTRKRQPPKIIRNDTTTSGKFFKKANSATATSSKRIPCVKYNKGTCKHTAESCMFEHVKQNPQFTKSPTRTSTPLPNTYLKGKI